MNNIPFVASTVVAEERVQSIAAPFAVELLYKLTATMRSKLFCFKSRDPRRDTPRTVYRTTNLNPNTLGKVQWGVTVWCASMTVINPHQMFSHHSLQVIIIIDSMTSAFNTDASLPYNQTENKNATDICRQPYLVVSPTRHSEDHAIPILEGCLKTSHFRCSNRPSLTTIQQKQPALCLKLANAVRALQICAFTSSVTLQSKRVQTPTYVKRSTTAITYPWIACVVFSDCTSTSMTLCLVGAKCIPKEGMNPETLQRSSHDFIDHEVEKEWREWVSLTATTLCTEALGELSVHTHTPKSLRIQRTYYVYKRPRHSLLEEGDLPSAWKVAVVTPIYKNADRLSPGSYWPISLTGVRASPAAPQSVPIREIIPMGNRLDFSSPAPVSVGVPQGSVLRPLLFLIYFHDFPNVPASSGLPFADDLKS
ncbi:hypothetical protein T265_02444 [Opisthorchis viverrini]|uniref:Reverse transcriptase domain-containing protein n=1 Tax=Opisthorchis viverrini TaxID=6198 RepID=A0A074ZVX0_OPIVI|nr:hypothetical protein T265_02444 [Opisthorchis viverrini]KER31251.1 hypothetical protein T265_02444 [Opisthorchis viverrini]